MLFYSSCFLIGNYYCYDNPAALQKQIKTVFNIGDADYSLLYTVYSYPNIILPAIGGILLDRIGFRIGLFFFPMILILGQGIFSIGAFYHSYATMAAARGIYGLSGECLTVLQSAIVSKWFKGKELAFALCVNLSVARLGSVINGFTLPAIFNSVEESGGTGDEALGWSFFSGFCVCFVSWCAALLLIQLDRKADAYDGAGGLEVSDEEKFKLRHLKEFKLSFWIICANCVLMYAAIFNFLFVVSDLLQTRSHFSKGTAGSLFGIPYFMSAIASPAMGIAIDRIGKRTLINILACALLIVCHLMNTFSPECIQCYYGKNILNIYQNLDL